MRKCFLFYFLCILLISCQSNEIEEKNNYPKPSFGEEFRLNNKDDSSFTFCVIPDTQKYFHQAYQKDRHKKYPMNQYEIGYRQMEWIVKNSENNGGAISFALMVCDIINNHHWYKCEWKYADKAVSILDNEIPYLLVMGNHDFDNKFISLENKYNVGGTKLFLKYFGPNSKHFKNKNINGGFYKDGTSSWQIFTGAQTDFLVLGLEFEPNDDVLKWAQKIIEEHPNYPIILVTHNMDHVLEYSNRVLVFKEANLSYDGTPLELFNDIEKVKSLEIDIPNVILLINMLKAKYSKLNDYKIKSVSDFIKAYKDVISL